MYNIIKLENRMHSISRRTMKRAFDITRPKRYDIDLYDNIRSEFRRGNTLRQLDIVMRDTINSAWNEAESLLVAASKDEEEDDEYINLLLFGILYATSYYATNASEFIIGDLNRRDLSTTNVRDLERIEASKLGLYSRTFVNFVYSNTQYYCYKKSDVEYVEFSATLDDRTSTICRMMDGTIFPIDSTEAREYTPPLHNNCRSRLIDAGKQVNDNYLYDKRDYTKTKDGQKIDYANVERNFKYIDSFNAYWNIPETVVEESLMNIGLL